MRKITFFISAFFTAVLPMAGIESAQAASNCLGILTTSTLRCDFKRDDGFAAPYCTQISPDISILSNFFMLFPGGTLLSCTCEASGSFTAPKFHTAKDFLCGAVDDGSEFSDSASGKVLGKKIKKGQYLDGNTPAHSWVFQCEPDPVLCP